MALKKCDKCEQKKGPRAFAKGDCTCRECRGSNRPKVGKSQGGVRPENGANGHGKPRALSDLKVGREGASDAERDAAIAWLTGKREQIDTMIAALRVL